MLSFLPVAMRAGSDDVSGESVFVVPETMSIAEARTVAASRARIDALAGKYGTLVASMNTVGMSDGTLHNLYVALARNLTEYTLNDMLVSTPVPETNDGCTDEYYETWILLIHRITCLPVEHVSCTIAVVQLAAVVHHICPTCRDASTGEGRETEEEHEE